MHLWNKPEPILGFLDRGTSIDGDLRFSGTLRIDGNFHGAITSQDTLIIGEHAEVHADIRVGELLIHGEVTGNVEVRGRTEIYSSGRLHGDLRTASLIVQVDAVLDGRSHMPDQDGTTHPAPGQLEGHEPGRGLQAQF